MIPTEISIEVHCDSPQWADKENSYYRLYIDNELLTERTWIWNCRTYIKENVVVNIEHAQQHKIRLETVYNQPQASAKFRLDNLLVNHIPFASNEPDLISFQV